jgi:hypothetical protein
LILKLHHGEPEKDVRSELLMSLSKIPYGEYLETPEVSQDLTEYRKLEGEQRILLHKNEK